MCDRLDDVELAVAPVDAVLLVVVDGEPGGPQQVLRDQRAALGARHP